MKSAFIEIDPMGCQKDGLYASVCLKVFSEKSLGSTTTTEREKFCNSCGHCVKVCLFKVIKAHSYCPAERLHESKKQSHARLWLDL
jgi:Fe-S-cluster-containing hydrogenase component 2